MIRQWIYKWFRIPKPVVLPKSPCGYDETHYFWTVKQGWPCPMCAAISRERQQEIESSRLAEEIAYNVVRILDQKSRKP